VAFLDPYGMQVEWSTIQEIARTACIDLWYLFPVSMIMRLTPHNGQVPEGWAAALDKILPDSNWRTEFYTDLNEPDLFDVAVSKRQRLVNINSVEQYLINGMNQIFAGVGEKAVPLRNSKGSCMYLLTFAVGNPRGADLALRMARSVLKS
jgi:three-Cys-motif partner protein